MSTPNPFGSGDFGSSNPYQSFGAPTGYDNSRPPSNSALGIISLCLGGLGMVTTCCCGLFGIPIPVLAIVVGVVALFMSDGPGRAMGIGGIVCGVLSLLLVAVLFAVLASDPQFLRNLQQLQQP